MNKRKHNARKAHQRHLAELKAMGPDFSKKHIPPHGDPDHWKHEADRAADLENLVFSRPHLRWDRHAAMRHRRRVRSLVKTTWERYLRLSR